MQISRQHLVLVGLVIISLLGLTWYANSTPSDTKSPIQSSLDSLREAREKQQKLENEISRGVWEKCYTESLTLSGKVFDEQQGIAYQCWTSEKQKLIYGTGNLTPVSEVPIQGIKQSTQMIHGTIREHSTSGTSQNIQNNSSSVQSANQSDIHESRNLSRSISATNVKSVSQSSDIRESSSLFDIVPRAAASELRQVKSEKQSPSVSPKITPAQTAEPSSHIENLSVNSATPKSEKTKSSAQSVKKNELMQSSVIDLTKIGYRYEPTRSLITACNKARDPLHCKLYGLSIMYNEAGNQQNSKACVTRKNCMGLNSGKMVFKSYQYGMDDWVRRYNRYWHNATSMSQFYAPRGKKSYYGYCASEDSSNSTVGCPKGLQITSAKFAQLSLIFKK